MKQIEYSVVVPVMNEEENVELLYESITQVLQGMDQPYEIIIVDDGSTDLTHSILESIHGKDKHLKVVKFRKNFGQSAAMAAGVYMIFFHSGKAPFLRKILDLPAMAIINKQVMKITDSFASFRGKTRALTWGMALSLLLQFNVIFHYYLISEALGLSIPLVKFLVIIPLSMFIQMIRCPSMASGFVNHFMCSF